MSSSSFDFRLGEESVKVEIPEENLLYQISPKVISNSKDFVKTLKRSVEDPIESEPLSKRVEKGMDVVIVADDLTRPTPQKEIIPPLLNSLNDAGVEDKDITILIALGTHRYMTDEEIETRFGEEIVERVEIVNHRWKEEENLADLGRTESGIPVKVNKIATEADFLIGVGSVVPHVQAGWGGGCKIIQPGVCSDETTQETHMLAAKVNDPLGIPGKVENPVREEIDKIGRMAGLDFIVNIIFDGEDNLVDFVAGHPIKAHREGIKLSREIFVREIPHRADIVIVEAYPADLDYWQGGKPVAYAQLGVKEGGYVILVGEFEEGISPVHKDMSRYASEPYEVIEENWKSGEIEDGVCAAALFLHKVNIGHSNLICVSTGLSPEDKENLQFDHADSLDEAVKMARKKIEGSPEIGIINKGGDVLPAPE